MVSSVFIVVVLHLILTVVYGEVRQCGYEEFTCRENSRCVPIRFICDKENDCSDGSDEENCDQCRNTRSGECLNYGKCIPTGGDSFTCLCDGHATGLLCETVFPCEEDNFFRCTDGRCKPLSFVCDGDDDCGDRSDEQNCYRCANTRSGRCRNGGKCIPRGDGITCICDSRYTGELCETALPCTDSEYPCSNGRCINDRYKCDGDNDCGDESDEDNCDMNSAGKRQCELTLGACWQRVRIRLGAFSTSESVVQYLKGMSIENHCRWVAPLINCFNDVDEECADVDGPWSGPMDIIKDMHNFICIQKLNAFKENFNCLANLRTINDYELCLDSATRDLSTQGCNDESINLLFQSLTDCAKRSMVVRINNNEDDCHPGAEDLMADLFTEISKLKFDLCEGGLSRRSQKSIWKKRYFGFF